MYIYFILMFLAACQAQQKSLNVVVPIANSPICTSRNGYYKKDGSCDAFVECRDFHATNMLCPDGLHYNPDAVWPAYPCGYPMDVPCLNRGDVQPAQPTAQCPHQFGFYRSDSSTPQNCGSYKMCVGGEAIEMSCPTGLAFNYASGRCDWPDQVAECNAEEFLGFQCPAPPLDESGNPIDAVQNYKYEGDCYYFFSCQLGRARLLSCDYGFAFDAVSGRCVDATLVQCQQAVPTPYKSS